MILVEDNCYPPTPIIKAVIDEGESSTPSFSRKNDVTTDLHLSLNNYLEKSRNNKFFSFFGDYQEKRKIKNADDELIIAITSKNGEPHIQTGNYIGKIIWDGVEINITSRFGKLFLGRMLNFANDVYLDDVDVSGEDAKDRDLFRYILYYLFVQSLEKAYLLGLPRTYQSVEHREMKLKGRLDINRYIKRDIPFMGKISSVSRELREVKSIVDVLHKAVTVIESDGKSFTKNILHIKPHLREAKSGNFVSSQTITKAKESKALLNPIFSPYKRVLRYAEYIIKLGTLKEAKEREEQFSGFLINVAELFEIYVTKLLQKKFHEWRVSSPKISLYSERFYARMIIPDIVMQRERGNEVIVFDTKYKRMNFNGKTNYGMGDVDRTDFFQINTYMSYYQQRKSVNLLAGGLLYPLSQKLDTTKCHSPNWMGNDNTRFIVDGLELPEGNDVTIDKILNAEQAFVGRIQVTLGIITTESPLIGKSPVSSLVTI